MPGNPADLEIGTLLWGWGTPGPSSSVTSLRFPSQTCSLESRPGDRHPTSGWGSPGPQISVSSMNWFEWNAEKVKKGLCKLRIEN